MEFIYPAISKKANVACVYKMIIGDAFYIGSTKNIHVRIRSWKQHIVEGISQNRNVTKALENTDKVIFEILEVVTDGEHQKHEGEYLEKYWGNPQLLNLSKNPYVPCGFKSKYNKNRPPKKPRGFNSKKVNQLDADGNLVQTHPYIMAVARYFGVSDHKHIKRVANGKEGVCKTYRGFTLKFA